MKIHSLQIRNFLGIQELSLSPDGKFQFIKGRNGTGKTSLLEAISYAFSGRKKGMKIKEYINKDAESSEIYIDLGDLKISRELQNGKENVRAHRKDGSEMSDPKKYLKSLVQGLSFNPIEFAFAPRDDQKNLVLRALKIQYEFKDVVRDGIAPNNTEFGDLEGVNLVSSVEDLLICDVRDLKKEKEVLGNYIKKLLENIPEDDNFISSESIQELDDDIEKYNLVIQNLNKEIYNSKETILKEEQKVKHSIDCSEKVASIIGKNIQKLENIELEIFAKNRDDIQKIVLKNIDYYKSSISETTEKVKSSKGDLEIFKKKIELEIESIQSRIENGSRIIENQKSKKTEVMQKFETQTSKKELDSKEKELELLEEQLKTAENKIDKLRKIVKPRLVNDSNLKVEGLTFDDRDFYVNGVILHNLSDSEKLRIAVKIAQSISGDIKFILLDGIERIDPDSMNEFLKELHLTNFQYFFTTCQPVESNSGETLTL